MTNDRLNLDDLARLEAAWDRLRHPVVGRLADGLTDAEIDELVDGLPFRFPDELRVWWRWHNGVVPVSDPDLNSNRLIPPLMMPFIPLHEAVEHYAFMRRFSVEEFTDPTEFPGRDHWWEPNWFPWLMEGQRTVIGVCPSDKTQPVPVEIFDLQGPELVGVTQAESIGGAVNLWIDYMDNDGFSYNSADDAWSDDASKRPTGAETTQLLDKA